MGLAQDHNEIYERVARNQTNIIIFRIKTI